MCKFSCIKLRDFKSGDQPGQIKVVMGQVGKSRVQASLSLKKLSPIESES